jgi:hypothetical protein
MPRSGSAVSTQRCHRERKRGARSPHEWSDMRDRQIAAPDVAEPVIGRAFARPVGSSGLRRAAPLRKRSAFVAGNDDEHSNDRP